MPYLKSKNPYNPGYALPKNVLAEPKVRGAITTPKAPGGTIDSYRPAKKGSFWDSNYALPKNVKQETPGQGVLVTPFAPRGSISALVSPTFRRPEPVHSPKNKGLGIYEDNLFQSRSKTGLDGVEGISKDDPIAVEAGKIADDFLKAVQELPAGNRAKGLRSLLSHLSATIAHDVDTKAAALHAREPGLPSAVVLKRALNAALANYFAEKLYRIGRTGSFSTLGCAACSERLNGLSGYQDMAGVLSSIKDAARWVKDKVDDGLCKIGSTKVGQVAVMGASAGAGAYFGVPPSVGAAAGATAAGLASTRCDGPAAPAPAPAAAAPAPAPRRALPLLYGLQARRIDTPAKSLIPGVSNKVLMIGGVAVAGVAAYMMTRKK